VFETLKTLFEETNFEDLQVQLSYAIMLLAHVLIEMLFKLDIRANINYLITLSDRVLGLSTEFSMLKAHFLMRVINSYMETQDEILLQEVFKHISQHDQLWLPSGERFDPAQRVFSAASF